MIKKALIPIALVLAIVLLAWKFFTVTDSQQELLDPYSTLPADAMVMDINKEADYTFLGHNVLTETQFICKTFPDEIATCRVLVDSLFIDSTLLDGKLKIENIYSSDTIYTFKKSLFFVAGRKIYSARNPVLIQQLLLKIQKGDLLQLDPNLKELKALTQESKNVLVAVQEAIPFALEYNSINETATAYSFAPSPKGYINPKGLNFVPPNASKFSVEPNSLQFTWENIHFTISESDSAKVCEKKYRDAKICSSDSLTSAYINGLEIRSSNENAIQNLLEMFYENKGFQNIKTNHNINWLQDVSTLKSAITKLAPKFILDGKLIAYESQKDLKIWHLLSSNISVKRSAVDQGEFELNFDTEIVYGPYAVNNHRSKTQCLVLQTADETLYYLNSKGKILWKTKIDGTILGKPLEIDRFRNNKVQYVFNTAKKLYQIDILGRSVSGFPKQIPSTAPAILVKYKAKKERILVPAGKRIKNLMLDGKKTRGWNELALDASIKKIAYKKIKSLDCILAHTKKSVYILNPRGQKRGNKVVLPSENVLVKLSNKAAFAHQYFLNSEGNLFIKTTQTGKAEKFSNDVFTQLLDLGNYVYAIGNLQLVLLTQNGDLVENKFLNEKPWTASNAVLFNDGEFYSLFIEPGVRCSIKLPNKALNIITIGEKVAFSENKTLHFVDRL